MTKNIEDIRSNDPCALNPYTFFWGVNDFYGNPEPLGRLSQWSPCIFTDGLETYNCTEQFMMMTKANMGNDNQAVDILRSIDKPINMKAKVPSLNKDEWRSILFHILVLGNYLKFSQNIDESKLLLNTNDETLIFATPTDNVLGIGTYHSRALTLPTLEWGENLLGFALMKVRSMLRE